MIPKEYAKKIYDKFIKYSKENVKEISIIAINEIIENGILFDQNSLEKSNKVTPKKNEKEYWFQVKKEIKKL